MELYPAEVERLKRLLEEWSVHEERELEACFKAPSDTTTFLSIAQRLAAKGFQALPQEEKLNIITPQQVRFTLIGMAAVEDYCRTDQIVGKPFEAMIKDRAGVESNLDIEDYGVRVKVRREIGLKKSDAAVIDLLRSWDTQKKAFRLMKRWSFLGKGVRFDLSMVRSTPTDAKGNYVWQTKFSERDLARVEAKYEIEVELLRPEGPAPSVPAEDGAPNPVIQTAMKQLIAGIGEVLRGIQKHSFLIRKSVAQKALQGYTELTKTDRFRGVAPITLVKENMLKRREEGVPNIRDGYNVTDKADGLRMMGYVDARGELFLIDMSLTVYRTGLQRTGCSNSLVDGEFVTRDAEGNAIAQFLIFDCYIAPDGKDVTQQGFTETDKGEGRFVALKDWIARWNEGDGPTIIPGAGVTPRNKILVASKEFIVAKKGDVEIFAACARVLSASRIYHTDGLILTPNELSLPDKPGVGFLEQLKWKPAEENTVDFLVLFDKDEEFKTIDRIYDGVKPGSGEHIRYKAMRLYVGSSADPAYEDPRGTVLFEQPLPGQRMDRRKKRDYKPVLFNPKELPDTMAAVCYLEVELDEESGEDVVRCESGDPIQDKSIVECRYEPGAEPGWRWRPMRIRYDKTERYQRGIIGRTLNKDESAEGVWNSIHDPVTLHMIRTGSEAPSVKEIEEMSGDVEGVATGTVAKVYYDRKAAKEDITLIRGLRDFHRLYVKEEILLGRGLRGGGKTLVDLACGQGGDLGTWMRSNVSFVYGTDIAGFGIRDPENGIYRRYLNQVMRMRGFDRAPKMIFTIGSSAKNLATGEAGATDEEKNMMRSIYGRVEPLGPIPPFVQKYGAGRLREGADCVAIMFAIHYFFENEAALTGFIQNVNDSLRVGGLFVGCCFDGQRVFDSLRGVPEGGSLIGKEADAEIWKITKRYSNTDLTTGPESLGLAIDVEFISIGTEQREYLVPFEMLKLKMAEIGCDLLNDTELRELGLRNSTNLFEETYRMASSQGRKYPMSSAVKQYSFFNRWFIFKRRRGGMLEGAAAEAEEEKVPTGSAAAMISGLPDEDEEEVEAAAASTKAPLAPPSAAAPKRKFALREIFKFGYDEDQKASIALGIGDPDAAKWLALIAPFPITDAATSEEYPSVEHFMAAMKYKATNKPDLASAIFSKAGTIHQEFLRQRAVKTKMGTVSLTPAEELAFIKQEKDMIAKEASAAGLKSHSAVLNDAKWRLEEGPALEEALRQRWERDERLRKIVEAVRVKGMILLYQTKTIAEASLGGKRKADGSIEGENRVGTILMRLAGFRGFE